MIGKRNKGARSGTAGLRRAPKRRFRVGDRVTIRGWRLFASAGGRVIERLSSGLLKVKFDRPQQPRSKRYRDGRLRQPTYFIAAFSDEELVKWVVPHSARPCVVGALYHPGAVEVVRGGLK